MAVTIRFSAESDISQGAVNVWHYRCPDTALATEAQEAVEQVAAFYLAIEDLLAAQTFTIGNRVVTVDDDPNQILGVSSETQLCTGTGREVQSAAALVRWRSNLVGGSRAGRTYLGPLDSGCVDTDGVNLTGTTVTTITTAAGALLTPTAAGAQLCVFSRKFGTSTVVTGTGTRARVATQRGRLQ